VNAFDAAAARLFGWDSQAGQYPRTGEPGIGYYAGDAGHAQPVNCLLWRDATGRLRGILNHYPIDMPPWERAGNLTVLVQPGWRRRRIATTLVDQARRRWPIDLAAQTYTDDGRKFITAYLATTTTVRPGDRIRLVHTGDDWTRLRPGALGTVRAVDDLGTVHTDWDDGSRLGLSAAAGDRWQIATRYRCTGCRAQTDDPYDGDHETGGQCPAAGAGGQRSHSWQPDR
jgi:hypothetical protein